MKQSHPGVRVFILLLAAGISLACGLIQTPQTLNPDAYLVATYGAKLDLQTAVAGTLAAVTEAAKPAQQPTSAATAPNPAEKATAAPGPTQKPVEAQTATLQPNAYANGISFVYDPALAKGVKARVVDATGPASDQLPLFAVNPREDLFEFPGYTVSSQINSQLVFFPVKEYETLGGDQVVQSVEALKKLLAVQPKDVSGRIPDLPVGNADRIFHSQLKFFKFQNGSAVRYLTMYAQDVSPVTNDRLVYVVQGITSDGAYYVSGMFPVTNPSLPANYEEAIKGKDQQKFSEGFSSYLLDVQNQLNGQKSDSFTPGLGLLDTMIATIKIDK